MNAEPTRRRATQRDVARAAGVSQATVSMILNDPENATSRIPAATRERVLATTTQLGYTPNTVAQRLVGGRTYLLGFHTFEEVFPADQRDFYFPFLQGVEREASQRGYDLVLLSPSAATPHRAATNRLLIADGAVLLGRHVDADLLSELVGHRFPFVLIGRRQVPGLDIPFIGVDYPKATASLVSELVRQGHRRLGYVGAGSEGEQSTDRLTGFWRGVDDAGLRAGCVKHSKPLTVAELRTWITKRKITAVLLEPADDDATVIAFEQAAAELGLSIPGDLSVVVVGDPPFVTSQWNWTRFTLPSRLMGAAAVDLLIDILDHRDSPRQQLVDAELMITDTVAPVPASDLPEQAR